MTDAMCVEDGWHAAWHAAGGMVLPLKNAAAVNRCAAGSRANSASRGKGTLTRERCSSARRPPLVLTCVLAHEAAEPSFVTECVASKLVSRNTQVPKQA